MKQVVNFRLSEQSLNVLALLEKKLHYSKTAVVEQALQFYAKKQLAKQKLVMDYAGVLGSKEADSLLTNIKKNKNNKDIDIDL